MGNSSARVFLGGHCQGQAVQEEAALSLGVGEQSDVRDLGVKWFPVTLCSHLFLNPVRGVKTQQSKSELCV